MRPTDVAERYLDLLERVLTRYDLDGGDLEVRREGRDHPETAETMIGLDRLHSLRGAVETVVREGVPGDLVETGVWRGGACILMRAVLAALGDEERTVWVADSFEGLPKPSGKYPADEGDPLWSWEHLAVSEDDVRANFARYGLLDDQVRFLVGWFADTLPDAPIERLALMRLDGDMYESTIDALEALYPRLSPGGYVIVDDFGGPAGCRPAVEDFRRAHGIDDPIEVVDWTCVMWRRGS